MLSAITHKVSPRINECELTFVQRSTIDYELAARQHDGYEATLARLGVEITSLSENEAFPDSSFVEDTAIVIDELAIICSLGVPSRRGESSVIAKELSRYRELIYISLPATIEGGDVLRVGKRILVGHSKRTNLLGINELARILKPFDYQVTAVDTRGSLHLKSACSAINDETLFVNPNWIETDWLSDFKILRTPVAEPGSANVLRVGETVCVQAGFPRAVELVEGVADRVETIDMSELRKAEAGLTCCSIIFENAA
jgi:dimethylargininase